MLSRILLLYFILYFIIVWKYYKYSMIKNSCCFLVFIVGQFVTGWKMFLWPSWCLLTNSSWNFFKMRRRRSWWSRWGRAQPQSTSVPNHCPHSMIYQVHPGGRRLIMTIWIIWIFRHLENCSCCWLKCCLCFVLTSVCQCEYQSAWTAAHFVTGSSTHPTNPHWAAWDGRKTLLEG